MSNLNDNVVNVDFTIDVYKNLHYPRVTLKTKSVFRRVRDSTDAIKPSLKLKSSSQLGVYDTCDKHSNCKPDFDGRFRLRCAKKFLHPPEITSFVFGRPSRILNLPDARLVGVIIIRSSAAGASCSQKIYAPNKCQLHCVCVCVYADTRE